jgi:hypothetical protein
MSSAADERTLFPAPAARQTTTEAESGSFDPLVWPTRLVLFSFLLMIALDLVALVSDVSYHDLVRRAAGGDIPSLVDVQSADDRQAAIGVAQLTLFAVTSVFFVVWFFRAYKNLARLGVAGRWGNGWAIGAWFVPFLGFVRPKAIANDIWRGSNPDLPPETVLNSEDEVPWYHTLWWGLFIAGGIFSRVAAQNLRDADTLSAMSSATTQVMISDAADIVAAIFAIAVVYLTTERQRRRARRLPELPV